MVNLIVSETQGGAAVSGTVSHGSNFPGENTTAKTLWLRHDGTNNITDVGFFVAEKSGMYTGNVSAAADLTELIGWGDEALEADFGGIQINMDAVNSVLDVFPGAQWPVFNNKTTTHGFVARTGTADEEANKVPLSVNMGAAVNAPGVIVPSNDDASFQMRIGVPTSEDTTGLRQFDVGIRYTYTS